MSTETWKSTHGCLVLLASIELFVFLVIWSESLHKLIGCTMHMNLQCEMTTLMKPFLRTSWEHPCALLSASFFVWTQRLQTDMTYLTSESTSNHLATTSHQRCSRSDKSGLSLFRQDSAYSIYHHTIPSQMEGHCNIKALFSVLGGGLPQFNTSDHFLGRESLSYMPPDI